jgi:hypothetical protein
MHRANRRYSTPGLWFLLLICLVPTRANAAQGQLITRAGPDLWVAGLQRANVEVYAAPENMGRQRRQNWCWAASVQMMLNLAGLVVTQEQVVQRIYGGDLDSPANGPQIMAALSGWAFTRNGKPASLHPRPLASYREMVEDLSLGWPLIVGLQNADGSGHAVVITAVTYGMGPPGGDPDFRTVIIRDPWPFNPSRVEMSWSEFRSRGSFIIRNRVTYPAGY